MNEQSAQNLKPMPLWQSWMLFLVAGGVAGVLFTVGMPWLMELGYRSDDALLLTAAVLSSFLIALTVVLYVSEGRSMSWMEMKRRFRIKNITAKYWLLVALGVLVVDLSYIGLQITRGPIAELMPEWLKAPHRVDDTVSHSGDYLRLVLFAGLIVLNVVSEELLWRGYILPRQELQHGRHTWWIHGVQWTCFHLFKPWDVVAILPGALVYGWLATRTRSLIPGLVLHFGLNGLGVVLLTIQVVG